MTPRRKGYLAIPNVAKMLKGLMEDTEGMEAVAKEVNRNRPEDLIERVLLECGEYKRAGIRGQYEGVYRGHRFLVGWETKMDSTNVSMEDLFFSQMIGRRRPPIQKKMVFCISNKPGGYPTDGLRFTDEFEGPLGQALHALFRAARTLFDRAEIERLMGAEENPVPPKKDASFDSFVAGDNNSD